MKIGIFFTPRKVENGVYQYAVSILKALSKIPQHQFFVFSISSEIPDEFRHNSQFTIIDLLERSRQFKPFAFHEKLLKILIHATKRVYPSFFEKVATLCGRLKLYALNVLFLKLAQFTFIKVIDSEQLDLMIFPVSSDLSYLIKTRSFVTIHDLQHRINPRFPEVSAGNRWIERELNFQQIAKKAIALFVDSQAGKEDVEKFYPQGEGKIVVMPYAPPKEMSLILSAEEVEAIAKRLNLPQKYIFYPAKFWPHKNHTYLIKALQRLKEKGTEIHLVLTGATEAEFSTYPQVKQLIDDFGLHNQVSILDFVSLPELYTIYQKATALVMPTAFGPANLPILEAWAFGTAVITSDIRGCREQAGDAAVLANPEDDNELAETILEVYTNETLRHTLIQNGKRRLLTWTDDDVAQTLKNTIETFQQKQCAMRH